MAGVLSGLLGLFGIGGCGGNKEKDHLLDGPDMYHVPVKPYIEQCGENDLTKRQKELKDGEWLCSECGTVNKGKFCAECGAPFDNGDII